MIRELYKGNQYRVVHSIEEYIHWTARGWVEVKDDAVTYLPISAVQEATAPEQGKKKG